MTTQTTAHLFSDRQVSQQGSRGAQRVYKAQAFFVVPSLKHQRMEESPPAIRAQKERCVIKHSANNALDIWSLLTQWFHYY